jgi:5,10-methenyltetrahydrofolate synthetase
MLEPFFTKKNIIPDILLVPLLAFDRKNNRLGYGKGYYDRYLNKYLNRVEGDSDFEGLKSLAV